MVGERTLLRARAASFAYPSGEDAPPAVDGIDIEVARGELVCLIGPNGAGKSTLLKLLGGLVRPDCGEVLLDGSPSCEMLAKERARRVALVPQYLPTLVDVRVEDFVAAGRYAHLGFWRDHGPKDKEAIQRALAESDAADLADRLLSELSGGQRQRALIARALAQEADLLLFDEPTASLDPDHQVRTFALIADLLRDGDRTAVVATHELSLASRFASRVVLMADGGIRAEGPPGKVLARDCLTPVYGPNLWFGEADGGHPVIVPWLT